MTKENILIDKDGYLALSDFSFVSDMEHKEATHSISGVIESIAPECFQEGGYSYPIDWWALGILAYELAVGFQPFYH